MKRSVDLSYRLSDAEDNLGHHMHTPKAFFEMSPTNVHHVVLKTFND